MRSVLGLVFLLGLCHVPPALADLPYIRPERHFVDPRVQFEGIDQHPDQVFLLRFMPLTSGALEVPYRLVKLKDNKPFALNAEPEIVHFTLLAMNCKGFDKRTKDDSSLKWLTDRTPASGRWPSPLP